MRWSLTQLKKKTRSRKDLKLLKAKVLDILGGSSVRVGSHRYQTHRLADGRIINVKYSRPHRDYYWFGIHASLWNDCLKSGVTHMVFILGQHGFVMVPAAVVKDYLAEAGVSPKADGTVRHYHLLISKEPKLDLFHYGKARRVPLESFLTPFGDARPELSWRIERRNSGELSTG